jgi:tryptophan synthase alpha subunit
MSLDGHPIDLAAFGVSDYVYPDFAPKPSPVREVFKQARLWNVVLVNPTPGIHWLEGQAQSRDGEATYTWVVNFTTGTSLQLAYCLKSSSP